MKKKSISGSFHTDWDLSFRQAEYYEKDQFHEAAGSVDYSFILKFLSPVHDTDDSYIIFLRYNYTRNNVTMPHFSISSPSFLQKFFKYHPIDVVMLMQLIPEKEYMEGALRGDLGSCVIRNFRSTGELIYDKVF